MPQMLETTALWDTGATNSVVTSATAKDLGLVAVGRTQVFTAAGCSEQNTYLVNVILPSKVLVPGVLVSECSQDAGDFGLIVGMDIMTRGDLSTTNVDDKTCMTFRIPSVHTADFVVEANELRFRGVGRNDPCPCGARDANGKPRKFKQCCLPKTRNQA